MLRRLLELCLQGGRQVDMLLLLQNLLSRLYTIPPFGLQSDPRDGDDGDRQASGLKHTLSALGLCFPHRIVGKGGAQGPLGVDAREVA